jgi:hypothetical protein
MGPRGPPAPGGPLGVLAGPRGPPNGCGPSASGDPSSETGWDPGPPGPPSGPLLGAMSVGGFIGPLGGWPLGPGPAGEYGWLPGPDGWLLGSNPVGKGFGEPVTCGSAMEIGE